MVVFIKQIATVTGKWICRHDSLCRSRWQLLRLCRVNK